MRQALQGLLADPSLVQRGQEVARRFAPAQALQDLCIQLETLALAAN
jgi:hypothetical protein